jgi:hypothetical protein
MSMAAISIGSSASGAAAAASNASRARNFDSVMSDVGHAPREADGPSHDDADTRVAAKDDENDSDRKDGKADRAKARDAGEDPAALLALASSVAAVTRRDAATADSAKADKANAAVATAALTLATASADAAAAQPAQPAPAEGQPDAAALSAMLPATAQPAQPLVAKSAQKVAFGLAATSTADILAARAAKIAPVDGAMGDGKDAADAGAGDSTPSSDPTLALITMPAASSIAHGAGAVTPSGGETLATGGADRQLDLAKGDAWLDGLARDIASTADSGGTLRFQLSPQALGNLHVELTRGDDGTAVRMTTATVDAQAILADAKPRLIEAARDHGVHISDATIDLGGAGTATSGQHRDSSGDFSGNGSSSGQSGATSADAGGDANRQAQSRGQSEPDLYHAARRPGTIASALTSGSQRDLDAGYA